MYKKSFLRPILLVLIAIFFAACDKDYNELGANIVGNDHFGFLGYTGASVKSYNQKLGPVASNNLPLNTLGFFTNPAFGTTKANFVTQLELSSTSPVFNNTDSTLFLNLPTIDSVIVDVPYFKTLKSTGTDGVNTYRLDSIYGVDESKFKLSLYQSNYYLRDLDPDQSLTEQQLYYTDQNNAIDNNKFPDLLNNATIANTTFANNADGHENDQFYFDKKEHKLTTYQTGSTTPIYTRSAPSMRLHLRTDIFYNKIINAPIGQLASQPIFKNYFRGLYFKVENGNPGNMALLNFKAGKVTIYYKEDLKTTTVVNNPDGTKTTTVTFPKVSKTFALNLTGNTVSLLENSNEDVDYLTAANSTQEASTLYLKGGEGSMAVIDLFGSTDLYKYDIKKNSAGIAVDENDVPVPLDSSGNPTTNHYFIYIKTMSPNGIPDELDDLKFPLINENPGQIYRSIKNRWMINEANLTFNVNTSKMIDQKAVEPNRIFLYDLTHKKIIVDYIYDITSNGIYPKRNKYIFGGLLLKEDGTLAKQKKDPTTDQITEKGYKYKIKLTNYIRNLIKNDSTNVRLGLSVTETINNVGLSKLKTPNANFTSVPSMSVLSPLGTILYGTSPVVPDDKKLKLEIYYTKPN